MTPTAGSGFGMLYAGYGSALCARGPRRYAAQVERAEGGRAADGARRPALKAGTETSRRAERAGA